MARIYKTSDRLPILIGDIEFKISPLTFQQRSEIQGDLMEASKGDMNKAVLASFKAIKYSVKGISGVTNFDGTRYGLDFENNGHLADECVNDLLNLECFTSLARVATSLINGIPENILDHEGNAVPGITLLYKEEKKIPNEPKKSKSELDIF